MGKQVAQPKPVVVLVEDDASVLRALKRLLESCGFDVLAFSVPSAMMASKIPEHDACLVVDVYLPEMSGVDLCKALRLSGCRLPVILITARTDEATRILTERAGPLPVLFKPFSREALLTAISKALSSVAQR